MAHCAENTLESFELALRLGATGLETDVWLTKDGQVVCDHDGVVNKLLRRTPINNFNRDELVNSIPSLEELFERCGTAISYSIDVCDDSAIDRIYELVSQGGSAPCPCFKHVRRIDTARCRHSLASRR